MKISILFARTDSIYKRIENCDVYDIERDALNYPGGSKIIAHPPCRAWGQLKKMAQPRPGEKDLAIWSIEQIRKNGGVLEHPARSDLWRGKWLPMPGERDDFGGWTLPISQHWFGHRAEKKTFLYIVGCEPKEIPELPLRLDKPTHIIGSSGKRNDGTRRVDRKEISKAEREQTPINLAYWLIELAKRC